MIRKTFMIGVLACVTWAMHAEAQWGSPRGRDRERIEEMREKMEALNALNIEAMWAVLSFGIGLAPEQLTLLRGPFAEAWKKRASILEEAEKSDKPKWGAITDELKGIEKDLDQKMTAILNENQRKAFSKQMKAYEKTLPRFPGGGFAPPAGRE